MTAEALESAERGWASASRGCESVVAAMKMTVEALESAKRGWESASRGCKSVNET